MSRYFEKFLDIINEEQKLYGFISNGLTVLTTEKNLGDILYINARARAMTGDVDMPINIEDIGFQVGKGALLSDSAKNIALIDGIKLKNGKKYFDGFYKRFNPVDSYYTAMILSDVKTVSDAKSVVDNVVSYHIDNNNIDVNNENEYVPFIRMSVSRENNPGIEVHYNRGYQFQDQAQERMKMMLDSVQRDMLSGTDGMGCK